MSTILSELIETIGSEKVLSGKSIEERFEHIWLNIINLWWFMVA